MDDTLSIVDRQGSGIGKGAKFGRRFGFAGEYFVENQPDGSFHILHAVYNYFICKPFNANMREIQFLAEKATTRL